MYPGCPRPSYPGRWSMDPDRLCLRCPRSRLGPWSWCARETDPSGRPTCFGAVHSGRKLGPSGAAGPDQRNVDHCGTKVHVRPGAIRFGADLSLGRQRRAAARCPGASARRHPPGVSKLAGGFGATAAASGDSPAGSHTCHTFGPECRDQGALPRQHGSAVGAAPWGTRMHPGKKQLPCAVRLLPPGTLFRTASAHCLQAGWLSAGVPAVRGTFLWVLPNPVASLSGNDHRWRTACPGALAGTSSFAILFRFPWRPADRYQRARLAPKPPRHLRSLRLKAKKVSGTGIT